VCFRRRRRLFLASALGLCVVAGYPLVPNMLLNSLTNRYPAVVSVQPGLTDVVVLAAGGFSEDASIPINARVPPEQMVRLMEGVRLHKALPGSRLWVSVPRQQNAGQAAELLKELAALVGVDPQGLRPLTGARTTRCEARLARGVLLPAQPFYLVTSTYHMPRSMLLFRQEGLAPVAAPAGQAGLPRNRPALSRLLPDAENLTNARRALHEYLGIVWARLSG
jgi:uncharacterized SAM-binding protein YcdF (DUF218 family)